MSIVRIVAAIAVVVCMSGPAAAQFIEEARLGVTVHDLNPTGGGRKESGVNYVGEVVFAAPKFFRYAGAPRPYLNYSLNSAGDTDYWSAGLTWDKTLIGRFYGELSIGLANHDGVVDLPPDPGDPTRIRLDDERVILGSRWLFRGSIAAGLRLTDRLDAAIYYEHLSHAQILASGKNEALDAAGVRLAYKFGPRKQRRIQGWRD